MSKRRKRPKQRTDTSSKHRFAKKPNRREPKKSTTGSFNGIEYDSLEELGVLQWLFELKNAGYIKSIKRAPSYLLCDGLSNQFAEQTKSRVSSTPKTQCLLHGHSYTPEFEVIWNWQKARDKFVWDVFSKTKFDKYFIGFKLELDEPNEFHTLIEVKPSFDQNNMERLFKLNQKWMWQKHGLFVNLVKIKELFPTSFTPKGYLTTPTGRPRLLKWKTRSLFQFLNQK